MYPTAQADLVPLPSCEGPKLPPFDFGGPQKIKFLKHLGEGLHAFVFKVEINNQVYALKLFRFSWEFYGHVEVRTDCGTDYYPIFDPARLRTLYQYNEPFNCECRAFGRLREAGHQELATTCYGYILLDEEHEERLYAQFPDIDDLNFNGDLYSVGAYDMRNVFSNDGDKPPPIRGILKEFGTADDSDEIGFTDKSAARLLRSVLNLHQLGIFNVDVATRQLINRKYSDFSTAFTTPHLVATPEIYSHSTAEMASALELETFRLSLGDYLQLDSDLFTWNTLNKRFGYPDPPVRFQVFSGGRGFKSRYNLRSKAARERIYTFVDPRGYDWGSHSGSGRVKKRVRLKKKPSIWQYDVDPNSLLDEQLRTSTLEACVQWYMDKGFLVPTLGVYPLRDMMKV